MSTGNVIKSLRTTAFHRYQGFENLFYFDDSVSGSRNNIELTDIRAL